MGRKGEREKEEISLLTRKKLEKLGEACGGGGTGLRLWKNHGLRGRKKKKERKVLYVFLALRRRPTRGRRKKGEG